MGVISEPDTTSIPSSIGVALSGGGHRATAFGLGVLMFLADRGLNKRVRTVASVSGGSILNAFIALMRSKDGRQRPFNSMAPGEFDEYAAQLGSLLAGDRRRWFAATGIGITGAVLAVLAAFVHIDPALILTALALALLLISLAVGPRGGGTLWGWWGTWAYCSALVWLVVALIIGTITEWHSGLLIALFLLAGWLLLQRPVVAERAFAATVCRLHNPGPTGPAVKLEDMNTGVRHVFCATEMHTGQHGFFSHDFVYARGFGLGVPNKLPVAAAVQVSANFPGGFPIRVLSASRFGFWLTDRFEHVIEQGFGMGRDILMSDKDHLRAVREQRFYTAGPLPKWLMLTDGGVFDNLATDWYIESKTRLDRFTLVLNWEYDVETGQNLKDGASRDQRSLDPLRDSVEGLFVVNAGVTTQWRGRSSLIAAVPLLAELLGLSHISGSMYNNHTNERTRMLKDQGHAVVEMSVVERLVPTTLLPLGRLVAAQLICAGYDYAMTEARNRFGLPYYEYDVESVAAAARGEAGEPRQLIPIPAVETLKV